MPATNSAPTVGPALTDRRRSLHILFFIATLVALFVLALLPGATAAQEPVTPPQSTPDAEAGLQLYAERCANCHGSLGMGDGEMAAQLPRPPAAIGSADYARRAIPAQIFDVITNGIVEGGMPPFGPGNTDPLSESQRWDLVAAVYSLGVRQGLVEQGQVVYEENCQACHAADGSGENGALSDPAYWLERSDQDVAQLLIDATIPEHDDVALEEDALQAVVAYARTFTYDYADPMAAFEPIEAAQITGTVINETTGQPLQEGITTTLSAFTADFEPSLTMTTTLDAEGGYEFDLSMVPPELVYVVTVQYDGISYGSDFGQLERDDPTLSLEVPVYERSTDPSTVAIEQLHIILQFGEGLVQVSELYQFSQSDSTVFVGETGDPEEGTVHLSLPEGATEPSFDRSFGGVESFFPADSVIPTADGWADTVPLRPGQSSLNLLVRYTLPYDDALDISHPVHYDVRNTNLVVPDAGVDLSGDNWQEGEPQAMGQAGLFRTFSRSGVPAGDTIGFSLQGEARVSPAAAPGASVPVRDQTGELLIGAGVLLLALAIGAYSVRLWRQNQDIPQEPVPVPAESAERQEPNIVGRRQELLGAIAALDDAYEAGEIAKTDYEQQRQALKDELVAIWET